MPDLPARELLFLSVIDESETGIGIGVNKKMIAQAQALRNIGFCLTSIHKTAGGIRIMHDARGELGVLDLARGLKSYQYYNMICSQLCVYYAAHASPAFLYKRRLRLTAGVRKLFLLLYQKGTKVIVEIPTYLPVFHKGFYKNKLSSILGDLLESIYMRSPWSRCILALVHFSDEPVLYGKRALRIDNGVQVDGIPMKKNRKPDGTIHLIAVALMEPWHGYERIINSIAAYNLTKKATEPAIHLHLAGVGPETEKYKKLAGEMGLEKIVSFYKNTSGQSLDSLFDNSDIGLGSFGIYKLGKNAVSTLKLKEYCARGLPFIYGCADRMFSDQNGFSKLFPNDPSLIDMRSLVRFYLDVYRDINALQEKMVSFAKENLTWEIQFARMFEQMDNSQ